MRATPVDSANISLIQLEEVFATFNQVSSELGANYRDLETRVSSLSEELAATNSARIKELSEKEQLAAKLSALMDALPGGIIALDAQGIIIEENPVAIRLLGKSFLCDSWHHALKQSASIDLTLNGEVSFINGKRISISSSLYGEDGHTIILLTDVTENFELNTLINREKRLSALGEMAARLAHQIRTPLSSAILYLSHLAPTAIAATSQQDEKSNTIIEKIHNRLGQIEKLTQGMLSYIRGGINIKQEFSLNDLLRDLKEANSIQIKAANGELKLHCPSKPYLIQGNREALFNAISNLIENSLQFIDSNPVINIRLSRKNDSYHISIEDNGPGINDSIKEKIFDPFFSTRPMGTGLGLAVVSSVIKAHHGKISIKTTKHGGSIFLLSIPSSMEALSDESGIWGTDEQQFFNQGLSKLKLGTKL